MWEKEERATIPRGHKVLLAFEVELERSGNVDRVVWGRRQSS